MITKDPSLVDKVYNHSHVGLFKPFKISTMTTYLTLLFNFSWPLFPSLSRTGNRVILVIAWVFAGPNRRAISDLYSREQLAIASSGTASHQKPIPVLIQN